MNSGEQAATLRNGGDRWRSLGVYEVRCGATGQVWVGRSRNLDMHQNHIWFSLRVGSSRSRSLSQAWSAQGTNAFTLTPLAQLDDEASWPEAKLDRLCATWRRRLGAEAI